MNWSLDPELAPIPAVLPDLDVRDQAAARRLMDEAAAQMPAYVPSETVTVEEKSVPARHRGDPRVPIVVVTPVQRAQSSRPALLWVHGGGFVLGYTAGDLPTAVRLAEGTGAVVVLVDYRLAPEFPFPAALDDCHAVLTWMHDNAADLGIDPHRLAVGGISAGGGLAAALTLECRDHGGPAISFQLLDIPVLDDRLQTQSMQSFLDTPVWNRSNAEASWRHYLGSAPDAVPAYAAPARAVDLSGLPPAYVTAWSSTRSVTKPSSTATDSCRRACPSSCTSSRVLFTVPPTSAPTPEFPGECSPSASPPCNTHSNGRRAQHLLCRTTSAFPHAGEHRD